jgi:hypothetical protein
MSGIIFAGCSFTHGHGLWFYSKDLYNQYKGDQDVNPIIKDRPIHHLKYKDVIRFPRLVSQEFEMFEITRLNYSGNDEDSINFINHVFNFNSVQPQWSTEHYKYDEVKYIIFQTSRPERCHYITPNGSKIRLYGDENNIYEIFEKYNFIDYDHFEQKISEQLFSEIRKTFIHYENKGITPLIFNWSNHYNKLIEGDDYMGQRKICIKFNDKEFNSLNDVIDVDEKLTIHKDYEFFGENPPIDYHPSKRFHRIIADSIIEKIRFIEKNSLSTPPLNYI